MRDGEKFARAMRALAEGDFTTRIEGAEDDPVAAQFNLIAERNQALCHELQRLAEVVGKEGKIRERGAVRSLEGGWKVAVESVNDLIEDTVQPTEEVARVIGAVAKGDLTQMMSEEIDGRPLRGEFLRIGKVVNRMVLQLDSFADEVTRVAREVGTEGKLGGQARVRGVAGTWKDLTDNVNAMAGNLTSQVRNIAEVTTAVARGDLSKKITVDVKGEIAELKGTVNTMVDQLNRFASEVTRVAREVGTEGKLGGQAEVQDVAGTWADLTDSVNGMAGNLTDQVRNIADVTTAVASGDLSKKITVEVRGEMAELKGTINTMVDQLNSFASEVTRVAREVGTEGKLGGQARVEGVGGVWQDLTDNVNELAANLTGQVRNIAEVTTAVARGDLSKKITVDVKGEIAELKDTINTMVDQLNSFAAEVTRVAREVGTDGKLGGQAQVEGVGGVWQDLTDNVNELAANLTSQVRNIADVTTAVARGDLSKKITVEVRGEVAELKNTINTMVDQLNAFAYEVTRVAREVGTEGNLGGQAQVRGVAGTWKDLTDNVNLMAENLTGQVRNIAAVTTAVARGDLSKKITVDVKGEIAELKDTINTMVDQLNGFAAEVTRVAREVGTEGKLGGQAQVPGVGGTWKDLTDNVNQMGANLTNQVRGIAEVVTAVAQGDLKRKLTLEAKGEIASLAETINFMIDTLSTFGDQVTSMAREVGIEGRLGGQASVPGAAGLWRDLTDNVNQLAANLTNQVRAIAEVATAVTKGDLTRSIAVQAEGEMAALKDNINEMISNLKEQTLKNAEQDWLKTNLARFSRLLQGERALTKISRLIMTELAPLMNAQHGTFYIAADDGSGPMLSLAASYGVDKQTPMPEFLEFGETLVGQCAMDKKPIWIDQAPDDFAKIGSSLGRAAPASIVIFPALFEDEVKGVIELASLQPFSDTHRNFLDQFMESVGVVLNTIAATSRTETLLEQSQRLTTELQSRQTELTTKQEQLHATNEQLQEKAEQLQLTSRYKSEFLANMSHELRTPLNSLLILSKLLSENPDGNLNPKQTEFARTIHSAGSDLLSLINDILDLSKIESGTVTLDVREVALDSLARHVERTFAQVATNKSLDFTVELDEDLPETIVSDSKRVQQVVLNLLSNAFKFTSKGGVTLRFDSVSRGWTPGHALLDQQDEVLRISVSDTGIGIPKDKQKLIFEAFQQADGTTSRKFGGTGLGLSISREIASMLGGDLVATSEPGSGATFSFYLPYRIDHNDEAVIDSLPANDLTLALSDQRVIEATARASQPVKTRRKAAPKAKSAVALLVSGDERFVEKAAEAASAASLSLVTAQTAGQTLALAERDDPVLLLVDECIETVNPDVVENLLSAHEATREIPRLMLAKSKKDADERPGEAVSRRLKPDALAERFRKALRQKVENPEALEAFDVQEQLSGKRVFVIDDDIRNIFSLTSVIENEGGIVSYAESGADALAKLDAGERVDALLVDIMMPEMDGYETIREIRKRKAFVDTPIIAVTAKAMVGDRARCLEAGADDYIAKPVNIDLLLAALRVWTRGRAVEAA